MTMTLPNHFSYQELMGLTTSTLHWDPLSRTCCACTHFFQKKKAVANSVSFLAK